MKVCYKIAFFCFLSAFGLSSFSQSAIPDFRRLNWALYFMGKRDYPRSAQYLDSIRSEKVLNGYNHVVVAGLYMEMGDVSKAKHHLFQAASKGYKYTNLKKGLKELLEAEEVEQYENTYDQVLKSMDVEMYAELRSMFDLDVYLRNKWIRSGLKDSVWAREFKKADSLHAKRITAIIDAQGWPGHSNLLIAQYLDVLFLHISAETFDEPAFEKYGQVLLQEVKEGDFSPSGFALWIDRHRMWKLKKKPLYGVFWEYRDGKEHLEEVEFPDRVDALRTSLGLLPLWNSLEEKGFKNKNYEYPAWYHKENQKKD